MAKLLLRDNEKTLAGILMKIERLEKAYGYLPVPYVVHKELEMIGMRVTEGDVVEAYLRGGLI
ncbi:MAG: hypothetical protein AABX85_01665 [Nanoarchaeota archaeon]